MLYILCIHIQYTYIYIYKAYCTKFRSPFPLFLSHLEHEKMSFLYARDTTDSKDAAYRD